MEEREPTEALVVGVDFGTLSGRALVVRARDGQELGSAVYAYPHGVIEEALPATGEKLPPAWALQDPEDYRGVLKHAVPEALRRAGGGAAAGGGVATGFTAATPPPGPRGGAPLCGRAEYRAPPPADPKPLENHDA